MEVTDELMLTWSNHQPTLLQEVATLRHKGGYADVTLACEGQLYCAHKFVLAMCSDYFRNIFNSSNVSSASSNLVIVLKDVPCLAVEQLLDFMYTGEVAVDRACLPALIKTAENLQIRGLALPDHLPDTGFRDASKLPGQTGRRTPADKSKMSYRETGLHPDESILSRSLEGYDVRGEHSQESRTNRSNNSRLSANSREGSSPPCKRKRLLDYSHSGGLSTDASSPVGTPRKSSVSSPGLGFPSLSSPASSSLVSGGTVLPTPPSHSSPLTVPSSKLSSVQLHQQSAGHVDTSSPRFSHSRSEPTTPVASSAALPSSPLNFRAGQSGAVSSQSLSCLDHSLTSVHSILPPATLAAASSSSGPLPLPEDVEIKREADDTAACDLRNPSMDPSRETAELKEEPPGDEMDVGSSVMHADDEGWLGSSGADGAGSLMADASEDDTAVHSDSDVAGLWEPAVNASLQDLFNYPQPACDVTRRAPVDGVSSQEDDIVVHQTFCEKTNRVVKTFCCPVCGAQMRHRNNMRKHIRTHTGEKPFACLHCSFTAARKDSLLRHVSVHHWHQQLPDVV